MARKDSKRLKRINELVDKQKLYSLEEALELAKKTASCKFDETVEVAVNLGVNPKYQNQQVRAQVTLPHGSGKTPKVLVFARGDKAKEAEAAGADIVGDIQLVEKVKNGFLDFDYAIATPDMMKEVSKLGKILGPRKLMPNPKSGTLTNEPGLVVKELKKGRIEFRCDPYGIIHVPIGKVSFELKKLVENFKVLLKAILQAKPVGLKGKYIKKISCSTTMGCGIKIDPKVIKEISAKEIL
jgi:large subunit ribosomal protein L1